MKIKYLLAASVVSLSAAATIATPAAAQQITSGIQGTVVDEEGNPIAGATVTVTDTRTNASRTLTTGANGSFSVVNLTVGGPYTVTAGAPGFEGQSLEGVNISLQGATELGFSLASGSGEILVTGSRVVTTQLAVGPGTAFSLEVLETTPSFNRDIRDIIRLDPRVSLDREDAATGGSGADRISCLGGNDRGNAFTVDGISQGDIFGLNDTGFSSRSSTPIPFDAVRETQVQFAPFDVDYGQFTGCAINVVTKSGTNDYHFGGFFEYSDNGLRGNKLSDDGDVIDVAPIKPDKRWGFYLGGPVIKDRLFLFGAYEHQEAGQSQDFGPVGGGFPNEQVGISVEQFEEIREVLNRVYGIDTGDIVTNRPFTNNRYFVRADLQINDDHRLETTYQRLEEGTTLPDDLFSGNSPQAVGENTFRISGTKSNYYSGRLFSQWTDNLSTEIRYSRSEIQDLQDPIGGGEAQSDNPIPRIIVGINNATGIDGTVLAGPGNSRSGNDLRTDVDQFRAAATLEAGAHKFKFGVELNRVSLFNLFVQNATGTLVFQNIADLEAGLLSPGVRPAGTNPPCSSPTTTTTPVNVVNGCTFGAFGNFSSTGDINDAAAQFNRSVYSVFAQDEWDLTDQLSAVMGVRVDWYDGGAPTLNPTFLERYGFGNNTGFSALDPIVMPRLALTYDMDDFAVFSRAQLRGGVGVFSGGDPLVWFSNAFSNDGRGNATGTTRDAPCPAGQIDVVVNGQFTGLPDCFISAATSRAAAGLGDAQSISPDIKMPSVIRANLGFTADVDFADSGFFSGWNLTLDYIYSHMRNPFTVVDLSQTIAVAAGPLGAPLGLNGFTVDGRPIYRAIDPTVAGCNAELVGLNPAPVFEGVTAACFNTGRDDELMLTNADSFNSQIASFIMAKQFQGGVFTQGGSVDFNLGYAFTDSRDRRNMLSSTATSNFDFSAAFDRQNPAASRGFFSSKHNITSRLAFKEEFFDDLATRFSMSFVARSGRPYSLTFTGGGVFNDSQSGNDNALVYLPTGLTDPNVSPSSTISASDMDLLVDFANGLGCARKHIGTSVPRNHCSNDWYYDMDLQFSQEIPGPGRLFGKDDKIKLYASFDNFLNFLDSSWNQQHRRNFAGLQDIASISGIDAQGRYIFTSAAPLRVVDGLSSFDTDNFINTSSSVWRIKLGVSYDF